MKLRVIKFKESKLHIKKSFINNIKTDINTYIVFETNDILVFYIEFSSNQSLMEEKHSPYEKIFCIEGSFKYYIDDECFDIYKGESIQIESNRKHYCIAGEDGGIILAMLTKNQYFEDFFE